MKLLVFVRRRIAPGFMRLARDLAPDAEIVPISDERGVAGVPWWGCSSLLSEKVPNFDFSCEIDDIITRCRFLRYKERTQAKDLVTQAFRRWISILSKHAIDRVLCLPIDSYVLHTLVLAAKELGVPAYSIVGTPFSKRMRFTKFGELCGRQEIDKNNLDEIDSLFRGFTEGGVTPDWLIGVDSSSSKVAARRLFIDSIKPFAFTAYRALTRDTNSFSFPPRRLLSHRMYATPSNFSAAIKLEKKQTRDLPEQFGFLPLQFYPESTSDYWIPEAEIRDHHRTVLATAKALSKEMPIVVKEHPAAFGRRNAQFLEQLVEISNVKIAPLNASVHALITRSTYILGQGSTTTLQASLCGKSVLFFGTPFFGTGPQDVSISSLSLEHIREKFNDMMRTEISPESCERSARERLTKFYMSTAPGSQGSYSPFLERAKVRGAPAFASSQLCALFHSLAL